MKHLLISAISALVIGAGAIAATPAQAAGGESHVENIDFSFEGPFGTYDQQQLRRGFQVYREVCSACHGLKFVAYRTLADADGLGMNPDWVRAFAATHDVIDKETGEERPGKETDHFPTVTGIGMGPDLSLMAKARAGFHGPYGLGINQLIHGIGGPEYIYSVLTGYTGEDKEEAGSIFYENHTFPGGWIAMPPPLSEDLIEYEDGTPASVEQMAQDVSAFLMWTAEPKLMPRKRWGFVAVLLLAVFSALLYLTNKKLWAPHKGKDFHL
ncbi:cytochrome C [Thioclava dalianensis]|uniref:Cytochrome c1 n=1 Tax=Thioclava dalianensis TaxID=1185766 RepID=A0A074TNW8_9RHOB|nr:cytochrome c1 [Thioclava dalianensis]KEP70688.1 cytochrome C [Thioclava dalianensis]SFN04922.1 ubiquinol-cytochrome c reductase cytochrome c1 subunit [Thioclava dalianensis]